MPTYHFHLAMLEGRVLDVKGTELADESAAREHARQVACELMRHRERQTRAWRVEVTDSTQRPCFDLLFASVDNTIDHLTPELRKNVENLCTQSASLAEMIRTVTNTVVVVKAALARANGRPLLAEVTSRRGR